MPMQRGWVYIYEKETVTPTRGDQLRSKQLFLPMRRRTVPVQSTAYVVAVGVRNTPFCTVLLLEEFYELRCVLDPKTKMVNALVREFESSASDGRQVAKTRAERFVRDLVAELRKAHEKNSTREWDPLGGSNGKWGFILRIHILLLLLFHCRTTAHRRLMHYEKAGILSNRTMRLRLLPCPTHLLASGYIARYLPTADLSCGRAAAQPRS